MMPTKSLRFLLLIWLCTLHLSNSRTPAYLKTKKSKGDEPLSPEQQRLVEELGITKDGKLKDFREERVMTQNIQDDNLKEQGKSSAKKQTKQRTPFYMKQLLKQQKEKADAEAAAEQGKPEPDTVGLLVQGFSPRPSSPLLNYSTEVTLQPPRIRATGLESAGILSPAENLSHNDRLKHAILQFLNTTQIHREVGLFSVTSNGFAADNFNPEWGVYHLRHVCVKGGTDGLYMGAIEKLDPTDIFFKDSLTAAAWNQMLTEIGQSGMFAKQFDSAKDEITKVRHVKGSTFFMNCMQQHIDSQDNHISKILRKFGFLYELSRTFRLNADKAFGSTLFSEAMKTPFTNIFMHQCGEPQGSDLTTQVLTLILDHMKGSKLLDPSYDAPLTRPYDPDPRGEASHFICFDDMYTSVRNKWWMQGSDNIRNFRLDLISKMRMQDILSDTVDEVQDKEQSHGRQIYCPDASSTVSSARIKILQFHNFDGSEYDGNFINIDEVVSISQSFTKESVSLVKVNLSAPITEQIGTFNSFDILITPSGDHLTNGIFSVKPHNKAVVEVVTFLADNTSFSNYHNQLGFADYVISSGHLTPEGTNVHCPLRVESEYSNRRCSLKKEDTGENKLKQSILVCDAELKITSDCRVLVNTDFLKRHISLLFKRILCRKAAEPPLPTVTGNYTGSVPLYVKAWENEMNAKIAKLESSIAASDARVSGSQLRASRESLLWISPIESFSEHFESLKRFWSMATSYERKVIVVPFVKNNETSRICDFLDLPNSIECASISRMSLDLKQCTRLDMDGMSPSYVYKPALYDLGGEINIAGMPIIDWQSSKCVIGIPRGTKFDNIRAELPMTFSARAVQLFERAMVQVDVDLDNFTAVHWYRGDPTSQDCAEAGNSEAGSVLTVQCADVNIFANSLRTILDINSTYGNIYVSTNEENRKDLKSLRALGFKVLNAGKITYTPLLRYVIDLQAMMSARVFISWSYNSTTRNRVVDTRTKSKNFFRSIQLPPQNFDMLHSGPEMFIAHVAPRNIRKSEINDVGSSLQSILAVDNSIGTSYLGSLPSSDTTKVVLIAIIILTSLSLVILCACNMSRQGSDSNTPRIQPIKVITATASSTPPRNSSSFPRTVRGSSPTSL